MRMLDETDGCHSGKQQLPVLAYYDRDKNREIRTNVQDGLFVARQMGMAKTECASPKPVSLDAHISAETRNRLYRPEDRRIIFHRVTSFHVYVISYSSIIYISYVRTAKSVHINIHRTKQNKKTGSSEKKEEKGQDRQFEITWYLFTCIWFCFQRMLPLSFRTRIYLAALRWLYWNPWRLVRIIGGEFREKKLPHD